MANLTNWTNLGSTVFKHAWLKSPATTKTYYPIDTVSSYLQTCSGKRFYSREKLLSLIIQTVPEEIKKKRYWGCRAGAKVKARLMAKRWKYKPSVPSFVMGNVNSLTNKTDELAALVRNDRTYREYSILCLSETWLTENTPDTNMDLPGFTTVNPGKSYRDAKRSL